MKFFYITFTVLALMLTGYMLINDFTFDNTTFSNYLITTLLILLSSCIGVGVVALLVSARKKNNYKGVMTIRQYYEYKSAR
ncbi:hypothetical protein [uncultured Flavobacterium sp.]|uniref:hypothetical protein n=1 Tax=uncultured Flavobacterium sp. TaxID=165435 RepID=UPI0025FC0327|nr:hypothetical protein [uncultured Flavobacterium sp.]